MPYVIACGDEGVQLNQGTRLGILGAGVNLEGFPEVVKVLKKLFGKDLLMVANAECPWVKDQFKLSTWEQAEATMQQQVAALADKHGLQYAGVLPFADPQELEHGVKGHMVRPQKIHIANTIVFTLAGGEQKYHLGHFIISAEWVSEVDAKTAAAFLQTQVEFYQSLVSQPLQIAFEAAGELGEAVAAKNQAVLEKLGYKATVVPA